MWRIISIVREELQYIQEERQDVEYPDHPEHPAKDFETPIGTWHLSLTVSVQSWSLRGHAY
jgi:hypothetical protein